MLSFATCQARQILRVSFSRPRARFHSDSPAASTSSTPPKANTSVLPIIEIPNSNIYALGAANTDEPILRDISWTVLPNEAWAVYSAGYGASKRTLFKALVGMRRIHPNPPRGIFPFLGHKPPEQHVRLAGNIRGMKGGEFFDFTARYGALREEDGKTLRLVYFPDLVVEQQQANGETTHDLPGWQTPPRVVWRRKVDRIWRLVEELKLRPLLDLPLVALSNGQRRRARLARSFVMNLDLLFVDEPLTGLDVETRILMSDFLRKQHTSTDPGAPHVIVGMRAKDAIPDWITHIALVTPDHKMFTGRKEEMEQAILGQHRNVVSMPGASVKVAERELGFELVKVTNLSVSYGERGILKNINWTIRENSRWHLMGENGAGKTTLLAMLTGEHPQSFAQGEKLRLLGRLRTNWPTLRLNARIGRVSPEMHAAFPRRHDMTVWDVVGTGFSGEFVPRGRMRVGLSLDTAQELEPGGVHEQWRIKRMWQVLEGLGPRAWAGRIPNGTYQAREDIEFAKRHFIDLTQGEQCMVLLMRALVGRPPLVLLDEVWTGMDERMVTAVWRYLSDSGSGLLQTQACVVISHWDDEVPWTRADGVKRFLLKDGVGQVVDDDVVSPVKEQRKSGTGIDSVTPVK